MTDPVAHPKHYTSHPSGVECLTIVRHMGFNIGNVIKYAWRADEKGNAIEDLRKAVFYLNDEIERRMSAEMKTLEQPLPSSVSGGGTPAVNVGTVVSKQ